MDIFSIEPTDKSVMTIDFSFSGDLLSIDAVDHFNKSKYNLIRSIDHNNIAAFKNDNLDLINLDNGIFNSITVGEYVNDVTINQNYILVSYFDQAYASNYDGVILFNFDGERLFHDSFLDCYAVASAKKGFYYFIYPGFKLAFLNSKNFTVKYFETPVEVHYSLAITIVSNIIFFHAPVNDRKGIYGWCLGKKSAIKVGEYSGYMRGIQDGAFIGVRDGYCEVIVLKDEIIQVVNNSS